MKFYQLIRDKVFKPYSYRYEQQRKKLFFKFLNPGCNDRILDFGGDNGERMARLFPEKRENIFIADISDEALKYAHNKFGFKTVLCDEYGEIPFDDKYFDITFCNSVIEHVTLDKNEIYNVKTNKEFREKSLLRQKKLADEIRRVSKKYFVQTPNKHFIIESHTWIPSMYIYLPRWAQVKIMNFLNKYWVKKSDLDFNLLTTKELKSFFPDASVIKEKSLFMTKSLIVIKN